MNSRNRRARAGEPGATQVLHEASRVFALRRQPIRNPWLEWRLFTPWEAPELLYMKFMRKEQTLRFALHLKGIYDFIKILLWF